MAGKPLYYSTASWQDKYSLKTDVPSLVDKINSIEARVIYKDYVPIFHTKVFVLAAAMPSFVVI